jgi:serine/threonine protein kinase
MNTISGRIEPPDDRKKTNDLFVFSALEPFDQEGRYKVVLETFPSSIGIPLSLRIHDTYKEIYIKRSFGLRPQEIQRNLTRDEEIFFEGNRKSPIFEKKRASDTDKVPEDQADDPKLKVNIMKTLALISCTNSKGSDHPFYHENLREFLQNQRALTYKTQINIAEKILKAVESIHQYGALNELNFDEIFVYRENQEIEIRLGDLESFTYSKDLTKKTVWDLGVIFYHLFKVKINDIVDFLKSSQEEIDAHIISENFPPPIRYMLRHMLQVDLVKRWSFETFKNYFEDEFFNRLKKLLVDPLPLNKMPSYARRWQQPIRFSKSYFDLNSSVTAIEQLAVVDIKTTLRQNPQSKIKLGLLSNGETVVRRIVEYDENLLEILNLLDLGKCLIVQNLVLKPEMQIEIARQIILGLEKIHERGIHGDIHFNNILISFNQQNTVEVVIADLEMFQPHENLKDCFATKADWSAPEVREANNEVFLTTAQDIWSLGLIFYALFKKEERRYRYFRGYTQERIVAHMSKQNFSKPVFEMICGMLEIDPINRWTLQKVSTHFKEEILK